MFIKRNVSDLVVKGFIYSIYVLYTRSLLVLEYIRANNERSNITHARSPLDFLLKVVVQPLFLYNNLNGCTFLPTCYGTVKIDMVHRNRLTAYHR